MLSTGGSILAEGTIGQVEGGHVKAVLSAPADGYNAAQNRTTTGAIDLSVDFGNMYEKEISSFADSILNGTPVTVPLEDAIHVQKVAMAAYTSTETKAFVSVE